MLRAAGGNPNEILFTMRLVADPRARQELSNISKAALQEQDKILKGSMDAERRRTSFVVAEETKRATARKSGIDKTIADLDRLHAKQRQIEQRMEAERRAATRERVIGNVLGSAGVRSAAEEARANSYRRREEQARKAEIADQKLQLVWADELNKLAVDRQRKERDYQIELERTGAIQQQNNARAVTGFKQTTAGLMAAARAAGAFGVAFGVDMQGAVRTFAGIEAAVQGVNAAINVGSGINKLLGAGAAGRTGMAALGAGAIAATGVALTGGAIYLDEMGYQSRREQTNTRRMNRFNRDTTANARAFRGQMSVGSQLLDENALYASVGYGNGQKLLNNATYVQGTATLRRMDALQKMERSAAGFDVNGILGVGGRDRLPAGQAASEAARYAEQAYEASKLEVEATRQMLDYRMRMRDSIREASALALEGANRVTSAIRDQIGLEREKVAVAEGRQKSAYARFAAMSPAEQRAADESAKRIGRGEGTIKDVERLAPLGGAAGDMANKRAIELGRQQAAGTEIGRIIESEVNAAKFQAELTRIVGQTANKMLGNGAQAIVKAITDANEAQLKAVADELVRKQKTEAEVAEILRMKQEDARAAERQAEK